jgi:hypothetical protein
MLASGATVRLLGESWWWNRRRDLARVLARSGDATLRARLVIAAAMYEERLVSGQGVLRFPGDDSHGVHTDLQAVCMAALWLRRQVEIPGLGWSSEHWTDEGIADLADVLATQGGALPWSSIADRGKLSKAIYRTRRMFGGTPEIVAPPAAWNVRISALVAEVD